MILACTGDELSRGQASDYRTHGRTDTQTDAGNDNTRRPKLASGKNALIKMLTVPKLHWPITGQETWTVTKYLSGLVNTISILPTKFEVNAMSDLAGNATKHPNSDGWVEEESFLCILARDIDQLKSGTGEQIRFREILHKGVPWSAKCLTSWSQRVWQTSSVLVQKQCYFRNKRCPTGKPQVLAWGPRSFHTKTGLILWFAPSQWETALRLSLAGHKPRISQTATQPCTITWW